MPKTISIILSCSTPYHPTPLTLPMSSLYLVCFHTVKQSRLRRPPGHPAPLGTYRYAFSSKSTFHHKVLFITNFFLCPHLCTRLCTHAKLLKINQINFKKSLASISQRVILVLSEGSGRNPETGSEVRGLRAALKIARDENMVVRVNEEYLDQNYDSKVEKAELEVPVHATVDAARSACGDLELQILNLGLQAMARLQLVEICRSKFPTTWYSPRAYQSVFDSNRAKLESKGVSGIRDLRQAFLEAAKKNPKIREQIAFMTAMEDVEI